MGVYRSLAHSEIRAILPHGYPMVLVDQVSSIEPRSIVGIKAVSATEPCYRDLPPGLPHERYAYPTSLLVESFGQTAAILWLTSIKSVEPDCDRVLMFTVARNFRIDGHAFPGDVLRHVARIDNMVGDNLFVGGETWVGNRRIASVDSMVAAARPRSILTGNGAAHASTPAPMAADGPLLDVKHDFFLAQADQQGSTT